jgi:hypothetical protein
MKLSKLMLTMAVAASAFAACNKQETTPVVENQVINKSVVLDIANALQTKTPGTTIADGAQVTLNDYQVFFADAQGILYTPKTVTAESNAETFFEAKNADTWGLVKQFHFLPTEVNKVIVIGNYGAKIEATNTTELTELVGELKLDDENNAGATNLRLYGIDESLEVVKGDEKNHEQDNTDPHPAPRYEAVVNLTPTVARFEVNGFEYALEEGRETREYVSMVVEQISVIDFYTEATVTYAGEVSAKTPYTFFQSPTFVLDDDTIYPKYFNDPKLVPGWYLDVVGTTLTGTTQDAKTWANTENLYAYHTFPTAVPTFVVKLTATDANGIVSNLYLTTKSLTYVNDDDEIVPLTETEDAAIYKMYFKFDDSDIRSAEKCINVTITVDSWDEVIVTPSFK